MIKDSFALDRELLKFPKIDCHSHIREKNGKLDTKWLEEYLQDVADLGIKQICVSIIFRGIGSQTAKPQVMALANKVVVDTVKKYKGRVMGYVFVHAGYYKWSVDQMNRYLDIPGMIGIKLYHQYFFNDPAVVTLIEVAAQKNALVLLHQGKAMDPDTYKKQPLLSDGYHIAELARQVPEAKLICGHIAGGGDWEWTIKAISDTPSVYADTSASVVDYGLIDFAARELGVDRLLFATDLSEEEGVGKILGTRLSKADKKAIFSGNFKKLLKELNNS